jgi:hypothetical protein
MEIKDMPKLESPFVRENINGVYVVTPKIAEGYEWVFVDEATTCQEKLHGTNVSVTIVNGQISAVYNRTNRVDPWSNDFIVNGVREAKSRGYLNLTDGQYFGEVVGPKLHGNPYKLDYHIWLPFDTYFHKHLTYKSWGKYPKDFDTISEWFREGLMSLFYMSKHNGDKTGFVEGVVFHHPTGKMAKLRRDMFDWFKGARHKEVSP